MPNPSPLSPAEAACKDHFKASVQQALDDRYILRLPFCKTSSFAGSRDIARSCFLRLERRFAKQPQLASAYREFMRAYLDLHLMKQVPGDELYHPAYYIPHHAVFNKDKIRVVFKASQQANNAQSINEYLFTGPKLQILTRWRFFKVFFVADIVKMYRQFLIHRSDVDW